MSYDENRMQDLMELGFIQREEEFHEKYTFAMKSGRAFNGFHRDSGIVVHIILGKFDNNSIGWEKSLCGTSPGSRGNGWSYNNQQIPSCKKCIDKCNKLNEHGKD